MLGPSETGEICVRGGNVMLGYWNKPEETAQAMRDDWLLTGDIGYRTPTVTTTSPTARRTCSSSTASTSIRARSRKCSTSFPGVKEAAVIGVPDPRKGEQPIAYVTFNEGTTAADEKTLLQFLKPQLADYKLPRQIIMMPTLPRNATGKILKTTLREMSARPRV